jgi:hypothetical protein
MMQQDARELGAGIAGYARNGDAQIRLIPCLRIETRGTRIGADLSQ